MRIGIMLRAIDEKGGIGVYTRNIVAELLARDQANEYVLFYRNGENNGRFAAHPNAQERVITGSNKAWWDQVAIPLACRREKIDVLFHPKFTAPLLAPCPVVMTVHGADWFMPDQAIYYTKLDVRYMRTMTPLYFKKCAAVISVSQLTTDNYNQVLRLPPDKVRTIYFAPARHFRRVEETAVLQSRKNPLPPPRPLHPHPDQTAGGRPQEPGADFPGVQALPRANAPSGQIGGRRQRLPPLQSGIQPPRRRLRRGHPLPRLDRSAGFTGRLLPGRFVPLPPPISKPSPSR
jgi:hypothetical protein